MFNRIVIANDGSGGAARALSAAIKLAKQHGAELLMVSVEELPQFPPSLDEVVEEKTGASCLCNFRALQLGDAGPPCRWFTARVCC